MSAKEKFYQFIDQLTSEEAKKLDLGISYLFDAIIANPGQNFVNVGGNLYEIRVDIVESKE